MNESPDKPELFVGPKAHFVPTKDKATGKVRIYKNPKDAKTGMRIKFRNRSGKIYKFRRLNPSIATRLGGNERKVRQFTQYLCVGCEELTEKKYTLTNVDSEDRFVNVNPEDVHHFCGGLPDSDDEAPGGSLIPASSQAILATGFGPIGEKPASSAHTARKVGLANAVKIPATTVSTTENQDLQHLCAAFAHLSICAKNVVALLRLEQELQGNPRKLRLPNSVLQLAVSGTVYQEMYERLHPDEYTTISACLWQRFLAERYSSRLTTTGATEGSNKVPANAEAVAPLSNVSPRPNSKALFRIDDFIALCDFLRASGIFAFIDDDRNRVICQSVAAPFLRACMILNSVDHTTESGGHHSERLGDYTHRALLNYYRSMVFFPEEFRFLMMNEIAPRRVTLRNKLSDSQLDKVELASLKQILLVRSARKALFAHACPAMSSILDSVFRGLAQHYEENDMDVALRMDVIVQLVQDYEEVLRSLEEHMIIQAVLKGNFRAKLGAAVQANIVDKLLRLGRST